LAIQQSRINKDIKGKVELKIIICNVLLSCPLFLSKIRLERCKKIMYYKNVYYLMYATCFGVFQG
jgi:hypothetical protein